MIEFIVLICAGWLEFTVLISLMYLVEYAAEGWIAKYCPNKPTGHWQQRMTYVWIEEK